METHDRLPIALSLILTVAVAGVLLARGSTEAPRKPSSPSAAAAQAHEVAGVGPGIPLPSAPGFEARLADSRARLAQRPDDPDRLVELARLLHDGHRPDEAATLYRRALAVDPDRADVRYDLAAVLTETRRWSEATAVLEDRLVQAPDDAIALYDLGAVRANAGDVDGARAWFQRVLTASSDTALHRRAERALERLSEAGR